MKKYFATALAVLMLFTLTACADRPDAAPPTPAATEQPAQTQEQNAGVSSPVTVHADFAEASLLDHPDTFDAFVDGSSENQVKVVFTATGEAKTFQYLALSFADVDESGTMHFEIAGTLYAAEKLSPERPLVIDMAFAGLLPDRGISYLDENGTTRYYALSISGEDGSLLLNEFAQ